MRAVLRSAAAVTVGSASLLACGAAEAGPAVMLNPYYNGPGYGFGPSHGVGTPHVFAYWYGHGTPGPGYWAGYAPAFAFPSIPPIEYYPAYGNDFAGYGGEVYRAPIDAVAVPSPVVDCPCAGSVEATSDTVEATSSPTGDEPRASANE